MKTLAKGMMISGHGRVIFRDVTRCGLHRACIAQSDRYPDETVWIELVRCCEVLAVRYTEKIGLNFTGYLWLYWKE